MESRRKYTASIVFNNQAIGRHSCDNLEKLAAQLIYYLETLYPNAMGNIRDNESGRIIQTHRKAYFE